MKKLILITALILIAILTLTSCNNPTPDTDTDTIPQENAQNDAQGAENTDGSNETPVLIEAIVEPVKAQTRHDIAGELFSWYKSEYLSLQFMTPPDWKHWNHDDAIDMYGGHMGDILKPFGSVAYSNGRLKCDILTQSEPENASMAIVFEKIDGDYYPSIDEYFDELSLMIKDLESSEYRISNISTQQTSGTTTIGGNEWHLLLADYTAWETQYVQRYYVNMSAGYIRMILITVPAADSEAAAHRILDMFSDYGEPFNKPIVHYPSELTGTWATDSGLVRILNEDGTGIAAADNYEVDITWGTAGEYGFFFNFDGLIHRSYYKLDSDTLIVTNSHNESWTETYTRIE